MSLPRTITVLVTEGVGRATAHALDVDVVAEADSADKALKKLNLALKAYFSYGVANGLIDQVIYPAPEGEWARLESITTSTRVTTPRFGVNPVVLFEAMLNDTRNTHPEAICA